MNIKFDPLEKGSHHNTPRMIVVHCMGEFLLDPRPIHATDFLAKIGLSAHVLVEPNGDIIVCREDHQGAYHAKGYNTDSLGIEFLVPGHHNYSTFLETIKSDWASEEQYDSGVTAVRGWVIAHSIPREKVVRHSDISPGRKVDPGSGFKWDKFLDRVFI